MPSSREAFVEGVLAAFPPFTFDLLPARARLWAGLAMAGTDVGRTTGSSRPPPSLLDGASEQPTSVTSNASLAWTLWSSTS